MPLPMAPPLPPAPSALVPNLAPPLCELARNPSLEKRNLLFAATVTAAYLSACGMPVSPGRDTVLPLARAARDGLPVRKVAAQNKTWTS